MPTYEIRFFRDTLDTEDGVAVVEAELSTQPNGEHIALVRLPDSEGMTEEDTTCGYETENGPCQREVDDSDQFCWQHGDE